MGWAGRFLTFGALALSLSAAGCDDPATTRAEVNRDAATASQQGVGEMLDANQIAAGQELVRQHDQAIDGKQRCDLASAAAASFLAGHDQPSYRKWAAKAKSDCVAAGVP